MRTEMALLHVGDVVLSSATSTVGCTASLLFCTLSILVELGHVVWARTTLSIVIAAVPLKAVLLHPGPGRDPCYKQRSQEAWSWPRGHWGLL